MFFSLRKTACVTAIACLSLPVAAQPFDTPQDVIEALYAPFLEDDYIGDYDPYFSQGLTELFEIDAIKANGEVGALGFDPVIAGQDFMLSNFEIGDIEEHGDTATAEVLFTNLGQDTRLIYSLVKEKKSGWQVDDIESPEGEIPWVLSELFAEAEY